MISKAAQYRSYYDVAKKIKNPEARLAFYDALDAYRFDGIEPTDLPLEADIAFTAIKANIDADLGRKHAGAPAGNQNARKTIEFIEENNTKTIENNCENNQKTIKNNSKQLIDLKKTNNDNDNEDVNEDVDVNTHTEKDNETAEKLCVPAYIPEVPQKINNNFAKELFQIVTEHNAKAAKDRKVPISRDFFSFSCKEMREILSAAGAGEYTGMVKDALRNFLKVCNSDTWQKSHTWSTFCKHYNDYTPEYFSLDRYLNTPQETDDATKKPENVFFFAHKDDPEFHVETFQKHMDDWKAAGRPDGAAYYRLQSEWEAE